MVYCKSFILLLPLLFCTSIWAKPNSSSSSPLAIADSLLHHFQYGEVKSYIQKVLKENKKLDAATKSRLWNRLAEVHLKFGDGESAMEYGLEALANAINSSDKLAVAEAQIIIIKARQNIDRGLDALEQIVEIRAFAQQNKHYSLLRATHHVSGYHMMYLRDFKKGKEYFTEALKISEKHLPSFEIITDLLTLSVAMSALTQLDSAQLLSRQALELAVRTGDSIMIAKTLVTRSYQTLMQGDITKGIELAQQTVELARNLNLPLVLAKSLNLQMVYNIYTKNFPEAIQLGLEANEALKSQPNLEVQAYTDSLLFASYQGIGDLRNALKYFSSFNQTVLQLNQKHSSLLNRQMEQFQKIQTQAYELEKQKLLYTSEKRKTTTIILLNLFVFCAVMAGFIFQSLRKRHRRNLFFKEKMISVLMEESEVRRNVNSYSEVTESSLPDTEDEDLAENELSNRKVLFDQLLSLLEREKLFLKPELDKNELVAKLGTNKKYLYQATKHIGKTHLNQILNRYRVYEAKKIIEQSSYSENVELPDDLYVRAGFAAKSSYYRIFKEFTGITPKEYAQEFSKSLLNQQSLDEDLG